MEPDVSIESMCTIRIAVVPIGQITPSLFREYASLLTLHSKVDLSSISSFYIEHQKSPFSHQPWDSGSLRFKFILGGSPPSPWEDFQSNRKILSVIGIFHCPSSPNLDSVSDHFSLVCKGYNSALAQKCFGFCPGDEQLKDGSKREGDLNLFPPADRRTLEMHMHTMMQDIAASLLMEFENWVLKAESAGTIVKTPLDSQTSLSSEEVIKAKKRRLGRAQKTIGDYCLLAGSPVDANAHYNTALELARLTGDLFWYAGALEGSVCALLMDRMGQSDPALEDEVRYRYNSVILHYRKSFIQDNAQRVSPVSFELESTLKLARFLCRTEHAKEVVDLLTNAADGSKSLIDATDRLVLYVEIARLYSRLGYERKAAFFSRQVAQLYLQQDNRFAAISALQVLAISTKAYRVESKASIARDALPENGQSQLDVGKMHPNSIVSQFESQWSTLQMVVLREILQSAMKAGDPLAAWSAAARLLRNYYPLITPPGQNSLVVALNNTASRLPSGTRCADPALPFIRLHSFPVNPSQMDIVKRNPDREDWWAGAAPTGPFIYTPFSKGDANSNSKAELIWVVGEPVQVLVELANPCGFDLVVESIYLSVPTGNFNAFPISVTLPPNSSKVIPLSGIPTSVGPITIPGCIAHCFGVITEHLFRDVDNLLLGAAQGLVLSDPFRSCGSPTLRNVSVPGISVVAPLPLLVSRVVGGDGAVILYEGEIRDLWISLANAGTVAVEQAHISLSGKNQDAVVSISYESLKSALPLKPGAEVTLPVTIKAWQHTGVDIDSGPGRSAILGRQQKDGTSPMLMIHYAGPTENNTESSIPPGRRLVVPLNVCVSQGLSFVKARMLSMEIPTQISRSLPKPSNADNGGTDSLSRPYVKIDPYRGTWGLRFLELELSNPTDVVFVISVSVQVENSNPDEDSSIDHESAEYGYPKTTIDRDSSARVVIPLEHFKLPVLDGSFLMNQPSADGPSTVRNSSFPEKSAKAELNACIKNLISRIKVRWESGRNNSGELNIKDAMLAALQTSVMDVLLPDPLTFGFRLARDGLQDDVKNSVSGNSVLAHDLTPIEVLVRNNTKEMIKMNLSITCRDVAGENCLEGPKATVLWAGVLNGITLEVPPLQEIKHSLSLYFGVPGEYTLMAASVINDANDILRARARSDSPTEPIFCRGPPVHVRVCGAV
ncbi:trafficking protein particle complex II-specific subunit 120 homolog [Silene latifolia]|uniref:trafficking protein particle complex II-specific subunit 120 homolog n=1 Tax=Silene latifolia TaxID=37657 RepID=UPI003D77EA9D